MTKFETIFLHIMRGLKSDIEDYCDLETVDRNTVVANDGSYASIFEFVGTKSVMGQEDFVRMIGLLEKSVSTFFKQRGHQIGVVFRKDLDATETLESVVSRQRATAERLNLQLADLIDENRDKYADYVYDEVCYFVLWSRPGLLDSVELKMNATSVAEERKKANWPEAKDAQDTFRPISYLYDRHTTFVSRVVDDLGSPQFGCAVREFDAQEMLRHVRRNVTPDYTSRTWRAAVPGTAVPLRWKTNNRTTDLSELLYPNLPRQIMTTEGEIGRRGNKALPDPTTVRVGSRVYAPVLMEIPPHEPQFFNNLFNSLNRSETVEDGRTRALPYSVSFMLESDGMSVMLFKTIFTSILGITSGVNKNINDSHAQNKERQRDGETFVKLRIAAMTWARNDEQGVRELALRKSKLMRSLEAWGNCTVIERTGNPMEAFQSNCLGLSAKHIGNPCPAPLGDALRMLPLTRPASPFPEGSILFRSLDGKVLRYQRFSAEQTAWITVIAGKMGSGKSVLFNNLNVETCLMPGLTRLPFICVIDIGVSSSGFIDLIRDALPPHLQHLALYKRLQNTADDCINPLDTNLGNRFPLPRDRSFAVNFLTMLATPAEREGKPYEGMSSFCGRMIDMTYRRRSDKFESSEPNRYSSGHSDAIDQALRKHGIVATRATTYWELVDRLFEAGDLHAAEIAQRSAVPTINDLIETASLDEVQKEYAHGGGSILLPRAFITGLREAISDFPIFRDRTSFDLGSARIVALDLQDVAIKGGNSAKKQTSMMYMIARQAFIKKVAFAKEDLPSIDHRYTDYYARLINEITEDVKVLGMDEYHRAGGNPMLDEQVMTDGREARKWNLEIILASQLLEDMGSLVKIATNIFVLDSGTAETRKWLRDKVGITPVEERALTEYVHGAGRHGMTFLARFVTKNATYSQLFTSTVGPKRLWALTTTAEDRKLRTLLYEAMPKITAREMLAKRFPGGSCKQLVDKLKGEVEDAAFVDDDDRAASVIERIARSMTDDYYGLKAAA